MSNVLIKIVIVCVVFHIFNQISSRTIALLNKKQIFSYTNKYYDCRWKLGLSRALCEPVIFRYFTQFNPGGIAYFIIRTIQLAIVNKVNILRALYIQTKFDMLFLNVSESNFRNTHKKLVKIVGE